MNGCSSFSLLKFRTLDTMFGEVKKELFFDFSTGD